MAKNKWLRPCKMAEKYGASLQLVNYWIKSGKLDTKEYMGIKLVKEGKLFRRDAVCNQ